MRPAASRRGGPTINFPRSPIDRPERSPMPLGRINARTLSGLIRRRDVWAWRDSPRRISSDSDVWREPLALAADASPMGFHGRQRLGWRCRNFAEDHKGALRIDGVRRNVEGRGGRISKTVSIQAIRHTTARPAGADPGGRSGQCLTMSQSSLLAGSTPKAIPGA